jgi:flavin reductase (DIM6/NTAB) family NADH-FMN oxidoreductase RutF
MPKIRKIEQPFENWDRLFANVGQLTMTTTVDAEGRVNAATQATCVRVVHEPCMIALTTSTHKDTYKNILATGQFVINLASFEKDLLERACVLGLPFAPGVNELEKAGLTAIPSIKVKPPRIQECRRHFECEVEWTKEWVGRVMIVGRVVSASVDEDCIDERGYIIWEKAKPVQYCGSPYLRYDNKPPYKHMFAAAYQLMSVGTPYDGPEAELHRQMVDDETYFR